MNNTAALTKSQQAYAVGTTVEVELPDFTKPGMPAAWWPATVTAVTVMNAERRLINVAMTMHEDGRPYVTVVGPRGGNKRIRVAA